MKREQKYPDTKWFHFHNENPKGRITGDCLYRAVATATGKTWEDVVHGLAVTACRTGYSPGSTENMARYLKEIGWVKHKQPRKQDGGKYTGKEFCDLINRDPRDEQSYIANIGGHHVVCIKETAEGVNSRHKVFDIWDSTGKCIGNYWTKG